MRAALENGALPIRKTIDIAVQIACGLAAAHDKRIIHRDLKPENVFLLKDGQVKILDFGLARSIAQAAEATVTRGALTDPGVIMGTVGYMAPEQVRGEETDARTDLFALGAVLYEMLSGRRAFQRDTTAETMTAVLREEPQDLPGCRPDLPPALDRIVEHCLEKNPRRARRRLCARIPDRASFDGIGRERASCSGEPEPGVHVENARGCRRGGGARCDRGQLAGRTLAAGAERAGDRVGRSTPGEVRQWRTVRVCHPMASRSPFRRWSTETRRSRS